MVYSLSGTKRGQKTNRFHDIIWKLSQYNFTGTDAETYCPLMLGPDLSPIPLSVERPLEHNVNGVPASSGLIGAYFCIKSDLSSSKEETPVLGLKIRKAYLITVFSFG